MGVPLLNENEIIKDEATSTPKTEAPSLSNSDLNKNTKKDTVSKSNIPSLSNSDLTSTKSKDTTSKSNAPLLNDTDLTSTKSKDTALKYNVKNDYVIKMQYKLIEIKNELKKNIDIINNAPFIQAMINRNIGGTGKEKNLLEPLVNKIKSIDDIGSKDNKGNPVPDGVWGDKTNAALINIANINDMISTLSNKLNIEHASTANLRPFLSEKIPDQKEINNEASKITEELTLIKADIYSFFEEIKKEYADKSNKQLDVGYANLTHKIDTFNSSKIYSFPRNLNNLNEDFLPVPLQSLQDLNSFKKFLETNKIMVGEKSPLTDAEALKIVLNKLDDLIKSGQASSDVAKVK